MLKDNTKIFKPIPMIRFPVKKFKKTTIKHDLGYRPLIFLWCERIKGKKEFPYFDFKPGYISELDFYFYHEPYSKKEFMFKYKIYKDQEPVLIEERVV